MANIIESRVTLEDEVFEETIDTAEEPIEVVRSTSYNDLQDLPQINGVTLQGNKTSSDLGIVTQNDINSAVSAEATLRENADTALGGRIDQEITDRGNADTTLGGRIDGEITNRTNADNALGTRIDNEILARQGGDNNLQTQIDAITSKSDVVDVVADYAALQAYDTQHLGNNDVIKVLDDETHDHSQTYYRWNKPNSTWTYIGSEAPYYSKSQIDTQMAQKQDKLVAGSNIQIATDGKTISATDTTYTAGNGLNLTGTEFSADTTVLATKTEVAPKLETEVVATLPTTGEESKLYLTPKNYTTGTASGNPITVSLGEDEGAIDSFQLDGDTFQQTYTGKNLFNNKATPLYNVKASAEALPTGVRITTNSATAGGYFFVVFKVCDTSDYEGQTITLKTNMTSSSTNPARAYIGLSAADGTNRVMKEFLSASGSCSYTIEQDTDRPCVIVALYSTNSATPVLGEYVDYTDLQIEVGSTATSYEPYVGGTPSPNPDYPQQIQTVTGEQTVTIVGKNLFDVTVTPWVQRVAYNTAGQQYWTGYYGIYQYQPVEASTQYTFSNNLNKPIHYGLAYYNSSKELISTTVADTTTFTTPANCAYIRFAIESSTAPTWAQLELGSTATAYAPYSKQTLPLNLGSLELCKLGTYQDYIWKDGDSWKVHKATVSAIIDGSESWSTSGTNTFYVANIYSKIGNSVQSASTGEMYASHFTIADITSSNTLVGASLRADDAHNVSNLRIRLQDMSGGVAGFRQMLSAKKPSIYARRLTPTETTITDTTLIAQLEAIRTASLENGTNTITNTATGTNLAGDMKFDYYEYDPTNRYDKWIWLRANNAYEEFSEEGGGGGGGSITVDSALSTTSKNPVQNKVVTAAINSKVDSSSLATVATSGSYADLSNKPTIPTKTSDLTNDSGYQTASDVSTAIAGKANTADLATVATSGSYTDLSNTPTIPTMPTKTSDLSNDGASGTSTYVEASSLATVATSGSYNDLSNKPTIPTIPTQTSAFTNNGSDGTSVYVEADELATVATSGSYNDLSNKPTIPTVNNGTLTIRQNGKTLGEFTANQSTNTTVNLTDNSSYSTSEVKTSATWINGKPIYKKTFSFTLANAESTTINHGISNFGLLIRFEGAVVQSDTKIVPIPRTLTDTNYQVGLEGVTTTSFEIDVGTSGPRGKQTYMTLWYTKTTD